MARPFPLELVKPLLWVLDYTLVPLMRRVKWLDRNGLASIFGAAAGLIAFYVPGEWGAFAVGVLALVASYINPQASVEHWDAR